MPGRLTRRRQQAHYRRHRRAVRLWDELHSNTHNFTSRASKSALSSALEKQYGGFRTHGHLFVFSVKVRHSDALLGIGRISTKGVWSDVGIDHERRGHRDGPHGPRGWIPSAGL